MLRTKPDTGTAHTPGPWHVDGYSTDCVIYMPEGESHVSKYKHLAKCGTADGYWRGNAILIAAAPELLRVAKRLVHAASMEPGQDRLAAFQIVAEEARAVTAKAEGRQP